MGMHSEIAADIEAGKLEKVLRAAVATRSIGIMAFARAHIYPLYIAAIDETYGYRKVDSSLQIVFEGQKDA